MEEIFETSDIVLATTLKVLHYSLLEVFADPRFPQRGIFKFTGKKINKVVEEFELGNIMVEPSHFHTTLKQMTTLARKKTSGNF